MAGLKPMTTRMFLEAEGSGDNERYYYKNIQFLFLLSPALIRQNLTSDHQACPVSISAGQPALLFTETKCSCDHGLLALQLSKALRQAPFVALPFPVFVACLFQRILPLLSGVAFCFGLSKDSVSNLEVAMRWAVVASCIPSKWKLLR
jgi:hypothetical protein